MKIIITIIIIFSCVSCTVFSADAKYYSKAWPGDFVCAPCTVIKLSDINFAFPADKLKYVKMLNMDGIAFSIVTDSSYWGKGTELVVLELSESNTTGGLKENGLYEKLGVKNLEQFFYKLNDYSISSKDMDLARKIMGMQESSRLVSYRNDDFSAFWIEGEDIQNQSLYIISRNHNTRSIQISGSLNSKIVEKILSSIKLR